MAHSNPSLNLRFTLFGFIALCIIGLLSLPNLLSLRLSNDFRVYFSEDNPELAAYERFEEDFTSHDSLVIIAHLKDDSSSWFEEKNLLLAEAIEKAVWELPSVHRVNALTNHQYTQADDDSITVTPFIDLIKERYPSRADELTEMMARDPQLNKVFLSSDQSLLIVHADLYLNKEESAQVRNIYELSEALIQNWRIEYPDIE